MTPSARCILRAKIERLGKPEQYGKVRRCMKPMCYLDTMFIIPYAVGGRRWMVALFVLSDLPHKFYAGNTPNLFRYQLCRASLVLPFAQVELPQEGVEWFLLRSQLLTSACIGGFQ